MNENRGASSLCDDCARGLHVFSKMKRFVQVELF